MTKHRTLSLPKDKPPVTASSAVKAKEEKLDTDIDTEIEDQNDEDPPDLAADMAELAELRADKLEREAAAELLAEQEQKAATSVTMDLPPAAGKGITMAGRMFVHGQTYEVTNDIKWGLEEAMRRCWSHEASLKESVNKGRTKRRAYAG